VPPTGTSYRNRGGIQSVPSTLTDAAAVLLPVRNTMETTGPHRDAHPHGPAPRWPGAPEKTFRKRPEMGNRSRRSVFGRYSRHFEGITNETVLAARPRLCSAWRTQVCFRPKDDSCRPTGAMSYCPRCLVSLRPVTCCDGHLVKRPNRRSAHFRPGFALVPKDLRGQFAVSSTKIL